MAQDSPTRAQFDLYNEEVLGNWPATTASFSPTHCKLLGKTADFAEASDNWDLLSINSVFKTPIEKTPPVSTNQGGAPHPPAAPPLPPASAEAVRVDRVVDWLTGFFVEERLDCEEDLSERELALGLTILRKKFKIKEETVPEGRAAVSAAIAKVVDSFAKNSSKRTEEKNKFIFKHTLKIMKGSLTAAALRPPTAQEAGKQLVEAYGLSLDTLSHGSLSISRLREVFSNKKFACDFLTLVQEPSNGTSTFIKLYQGSIKKKLAKILRKWGKDAGVKGDSEASWASGQCKLPWTKVEVNTAIKCFLTSIRASSEDTL